MKNEPKHIYLQAGQDTEADTDFDELPGVTFHDHPVHGNDLKYINFKHFEQLQSDHKLLKASYDSLSALNTSLTLEINRLESKLLILNGAESKTT